MIREFVLSPSPTNARQLLRFEPITSLQIDEATRALAECDMVALEDVVRLGGDIELLPAVQHIIDLEFRGIVCCNMARRGRLAVAIALKLHNKKSIYWHSTDLNYASSVSFFETVMKTTSEMETFVLSDEVSSARFENVFVAELGAYQAGYLELLKEFPEVLAIQTVPISHRIDDWAIETQIEKFYPGSGGTFQIVKKAVRRKSDLKGANRLKLIESGLAMFGTVFVK